MAVTKSNSLSYIASYSDLIRVLGANADAGYQHYTNYGLGEGRDASFQGLAYIASYGDLIAAFRGNATADAGATHFITKKHKKRHRSFSKKL